MIAEALRSDRAKRRFEQAMGGAPIASAALLFL